MNSCGTGIAFARIAFPGANIAKAEKPVAMIIINNKGRFIFFKINIECNAIKYRNIRVRTIVISLQPKEPIKNKVANNKRITFLVL